MMDAIVLGVDLATAWARVLALDIDSGAVLGERGAALPAPVRAGRRSEQAAAYADVARGLIAGIAASLGSAAGQVQAISVTGTSGTVVPCDAAGRPIGAAVLYDDGRADAEQRILVEAGAAVSTTSALARTGWLARHRPAEKYLSTADVVHAALAGRIVDGDTSHHLKAGIDPVTATWPGPLLDLMDLGPGALPGLTRPGTTLGTVDPRIASELGLTSSTALIAGMTDGCTAQIAAGAVGLGDTVGVLGTTLVLKAVAAEPAGDRSGTLYGHLAPDGRWWLGGASNVGAGILGVEFPGSDLAELDAAAVAHGPARALRYPLTRPGERFPVRDPELRGFTIGGDGDTVDGYRAILDGVAFTERLGLESMAALGLPPGRHHLAGGATASAAWNRIRATVLGTSVLLPRRPRSALGAALLAATVPRREALGRTVDALLPAPAEVEPDRATVPVLDERYQAWCQALRGALHPTNVTTTHEGQTHDR